MERDDADALYLTSSRFKWPPMNSRRSGSVS